MIALYMPMQPSSKMPMMAFSASSSPPVPGPTIVKFDSGQAQIDAIESGVMAGAITEDRLGIGRCTVESAVAAINGEELPEVQDTGSFWYDAENIDSEEIAPLLYQ